MEASNEAVKLKELQIVGTDPSGFRKGRWAFTNAIPQQPIGSYNSVPVSMVAHLWNELTKLAEDENWKLELVQKPPR